MWNATNALLDRFKTDTATLLGNMDQVKLTYDFVYGRIVDATKKHLKETVDALQVDTCSSFMDVTFHLEMFFVCRLFHLGLLL